MPTLYGVLLNDDASARRAGAALPPPLLYIKTANTFAQPGAQVPVPADPGVVCIGATLGLVIGRTTTRVTPVHAWSQLRGYVIASDLSLPHDDADNADARLRCHDLFCPMTGVLPLAMLPEPEKALIRVDVDGVEVQRRELGHLLRPAAQLIADVSGFITLNPGDILLVGPPEHAPLARAGQSVTITIDGLGVLSHTLVEERRR